MRKQLIRTFCKLQNKALLKECTLLARRTFADTILEPDSRVKRGERLADILLSQGQSKV